MGMSALTYYTAEMVRALPEDGNKYETVYGELLVNPSPRPWHEIVVKRLIIALDTYLIRERIGEVLCSRGDISWSRDTLVQPDVYVVPIGEVRTLDWTKFQNLLLIAEVLSPSSVRADRFTKRRRYQEARVPLYWVVDGDAKLVEVWTPDTQFPTTESRSLVWEPSGASQRFQLNLDELFRPV
ncbi:MAG: Uma2 family endonuclease [Gemmatimonadaceae bacterium]|nr:Uma2 family endonuclease [Gemmatimonadaceae bacterium]MDQ3520487.1 Uma2 family endonuclease [Gemmatimonadota bacterium]